MHDPTADPTDAYLSTSPQSDEHPPSTTPTASDVKEIMRDQNIKLAIGGLLMAIVLGVSVWFTATSRTASRDSANATKIQLATQERNACIIERRNAELDALRRGLFAGLKAQKAALIEGNDGELAKQLDRFDQADADAQAASATLDADTLNLPPSEGGCGPPILTLDDLGR